MLLALAAAVAAPQACPAKVGSSERAAVAFYSLLLKNSQASADSAAKSGDLAWAKKERLEVRENRSQVLGYQVQLGYAYLDAGCLGEAKTTFAEVWKWNTPEYAPFPQQAREALNLMASKRQ